MRKFPVGTRVQVTEGAGLDSARTGIVVDWHGKTRQLRKENPGYYKDFNPKTEVMIQSDSGSLFSMFPQYLIRVTTDTEHYLADEL